MPTWNIHIEYTGGSIDAPARLDPTTLDLVCKIHCMMIRSFANELGFETEISNPRIVQLRHHSAGAITLLQLRRSDLFDDTRVEEL